MHLQGIRCTILIRALRLHGAIRVTLCQPHRGFISLSDGSELIAGRSAPSFNVGVVIELRYRILIGGFRQPDWSLGELSIQGESERSSDAQILRQKTLIEKTDDCQRFLWTGLVLSFFKDGGESYWHSLVGEQQQIFVVCQEDEEDGLGPILVTADYDEAMAYQEADDTIFSSPMPPLVYQTLERFVLENYAPEQKKRRKRKQWHGDASGDERSPKGRRVDRYLFRV